MVFCSEKWLGKHVKFCPMQPTGQILYWQKEESPYSDWRKRDSRTCPAFICPWLLSAQSCIENLVDESHFYPLQLQQPLWNQVSEVQGFTSRQRKETNTTPSNLTQHGREGLVWQEIWIPKPSTTAGSDILQCSLPIPTASVLCTEKQNVKKEKSLDLGRT